MDYDSNNKWQSRFDEPNEVARSGVRKTLLWVAIGIMGVPFFWFAMCLIMGVGDFFGL